MNPNSRPNAMSCAPSEVIPSTESCSGFTRAMNASELSRQSFCAASIPETSSVGSASANPSAWARASASA